MGTRRLLAALTTATLAAGFAIVTPPPAIAADAGTVTVSYANFEYSVTPSTLTAAAGDTFTLTNTLINGNGSYVSLQDGTGSVTLGAQSCTATTDCTVLDGGGAATGTFTVVTTGTVTVWRSLNGAAPVQRGTLTLTAGGSAPAAPDPSTIYPTARLDANGGTCTGTLQFTKYNGQNGTFTLPTTTECTRAGYRLLSWTYNEDGSRPLSTTWYGFGPGEAVPIGYTSFTLYAQWLPLGVQISYDANVGSADPCLAGGVDTTVRRTVVVVQHPGSEYLRPSDGALAASAPCTPPGMALAGWRKSSEGTSGKVYPAGTPVTDLFPGRDVSSDSVTLAAVWTVTYGVTLTPAESTIAKYGVTSLRVTALRNGSPVPSATVALTTSGATLFSGLANATTVTTQNDGTAYVTIIDSTVGTGTITAAYGDATATAQVLVTEPVTTSITITGERTIVSGKPGIRVEGVTTNLAPGTKVVPWFRFPGESAYTQGSARSEIGEDGTFIWQRKTGKKFYVYVTDESGEVKSNRVIIPAN